MGHHADHIRVADLKGMDPHDFFTNVYRLVATHCCICMTPLRDALSVQLSIGPVCRKKYGYQEQPDITPAMLARALGILATIESQMNPRVVEYLLANKDDGRMLNNILVAYASIHYNDKDRVLSVTPVIRALGYDKLAEKLEWDRSVIQIRVHTDDRVEVYTPYDRPFTREFKDAFKPDKVWFTDKDGNPTRRFKCWSFRKQTPDDLDHLKALLSLYFEGELMYDGLGVQPVPKDFPFPPAVLTARQAAAKKAGLARTRMAKGRCKIDIVGDRIDVFTPYHAGFVGDIKKIKDRKVHYENGNFVCWRVPYTPANEQRVKDIIKTHYGVAL